MLKALKHQYWLLTHFHQWSFDRSTIIMRTTELFGVLMSVLGTFMLSNSEDYHLTGWFMFSFANACLFFVAYKKELYGMTLMYVIFQLMAFKAIYRLAFLT